VRFFNRTSKFLPYSVQDSGLSFEQAFFNNNFNCAVAYGHEVPISDAESGAYGGVVAHRLEDYQELIGFLKGEGYTFKTGQQLHSEPASPKTCFIRHDVDGDLVAAAMCGEMLASQDVQASFYILHTGPYYGHWEEDPSGAPAFRRHDALGKVYKYLDDLGQDVGLHTDGLGIYLNKGVDGSQAVAKEIAWFGEQGVAMRGTAPHNSYETHNACNSAIFKGRRLIPPVNLPKPSQDMTVVKKWSEMGGVRFPLGTLREDALGLTYEANDIYINYEKSYTDLLYVSIFGYNQICVNSLRGSLTNKPEIGIYSHEAVRNRLSAAADTELIYMSTHPEYYGRRTNAEFEGLSERILRSH
jgi:hypothetical protein